MSHPMLDGTPILLGDVLHAVDNDYFEYEGAVVAISNEDYHGNFMVTLKAKGFISEEFYTRTATLKRVHNDGSIATRNDNASETT